MKGKLTFRQAAVRFLDAIGEPMHYKKMMKGIKERGLMETSGKTPAETLRAMMMRDIKSSEDPTFGFFGDGKYGLCSWTGMAEHEKTDDHQRNGDHQHFQNPAFLHNSAGASFVTSNLVVLHVSFPICTIQLFSGLACCPVSRTLFHQELFPCRSHRQSGNTISHVNDHAPGVAESVYCRNLSDGRKRQ